MNVTKCGHCSRPLDSSYISEGSPRIEQKCGNYMTEIFFCSKECCKAWNSEDEIRFYQEAYLRLLEDERVTDKVLQFVLGSNHDEIGYNRERQNGEYRVALEPKQALSMYLMITTGNIKDLVSNSQARYGFSGTGFTSYRIELGNENVLIIDSINKQGE